MGVLLVLAEAESGRQVPLCHHSPTAFPPPWSHIACTLLPPSLPHWAHSAATMSPQSRHFLTTMQPPFCHYPLWPSIDRISGNWSHPYVQQRYSPCWAQSAQEQRWLLECTCFICGRYVALNASSATSIRARTSKRWKERNPQSVCTQPETGSNGACDQPTAIAISATRFENPAVENSSLCVNQLAASPRCRRCGNGYQPAWRSQQAGLRP